MIDINKIKQGDKLTFNNYLYRFSRNNNVEKFTVEFIERSRVHSGRIVGYDLSKAQYVFNISKEYINDYCTSWKRDGVELLKQNKQLKQRNKELEGFVRDIAIYDRELSTLCVDLIYEKAVELHQKGGE